MMLLLCTGVGITIIICDVNIIIFQIFVTNNYTGLQLSTILVTSIHYFYDCAHFIVINCYVLCYVYTRWDLNNIITVE
jgi:hypothetical protein